MFKKLHSTFVDKGENIGISKDNQDVDISIKFADFL